MVISYSFRCDEPTFSRLAYDNLYGFMFQPNSAGRKKSKNFYQKAKRRKGLRKKITVQVDLITWNFRAGTFRKIIFYEQLIVG